MRFWHIDFVRGLTIILMVGFNYAYALRFFGILNLNLGFVFWELFPIIIASSFILISGVCMNISAKSKNFKINTMKKGLKIFLLALVVTFSTYLVIGDSFVVFGILHFFAVASVLGYYFYKSDYILYFSMLFVIIGIYFSTLVASTPLFLWLGIKPFNFFTVDYFPLLPWFGIFLFGMFLGRNYSKKIMKNYKQPIFTDKICFIGKRSLWVYMLHQPVLFVIILLLQIFFN